MLDLIQYATSSFWVFLGTVIILGLVLKIASVVILGIAAILRGGNVNIG